MSDLVLHVAQKRALLTRLAVGGDALGIAGVCGLALRALRDPESLTGRRGAASERQEAFGTGTPAAVPSWA